MWKELTLICAGVIGLGILLYTDIKLEREEEAARLAAYCAQPHAIETLCYGMKHE